MSILDDNWPSACRCRTVTGRESLCFHHFGGFMRALTISVCVFGLLGAACKKKDEANNTPAAAPAGDTKTAEAPKPTEPPPAAPAAAAADDDGKKDMDLFVGLGNLFAADAKDCAKLATDVKKYIADNKAAFDAAKKRDEAMTPEQRKAQKDKYGAQMEQFMTNVDSATETCKDNKDLDAAMKDVL
jgi:hypothetical protein